MSYNISLFTVATKRKEQESGEPDFFENVNNLGKFSAAQKSALQERLLRYEYKCAADNNDGQIFEHNDFGEALLTDYGLYFSTNENFDCIFEVGLIASEFTDTDEFAKYDSQAGEWEE